MSNIKPNPNWPSISDPAPTAAPAKFPYDHSSVGDERALRQCPHGEPLAGVCRDCDRDHREATA